jgi:hypothetical protein
MTNPLTSAGAVDVPSREACAAVIGHRRELVDQVVGLRRLVGRQIRPEGGPAVAGRLDGHIGVLARQLAPVVHGVGVELGEQFERPPLEAPQRQVARVGQQPGCEAPGKW